MNPTKAAAVLALIVALIAAGYVCYQFYENYVLLRDVRSAISDDAEYGGGSTVEYLIPGGIAITALIVSLVLFGAAKQKT